MISDCPCVSIKIGGYTIISVYREWRLLGQPESDKLDDQIRRLNSFLTSIKEVKGNTIILGDLNIDINEKNLESQYYCSLRALRELLASDMTTLGFDQLVKKNTRHQKGKRSSLLDHVYFRGSKKLISRQYNRNVLGDDHNLVGASLFTSVDENPSAFYFKRNIDRVTEEAFECIFNCSLPWEVSSECDVNNSVNLLVDKITWTLNHLCPVSKKQRRVKYQPWMNDQLKDMCRHKNYLFKQAKDSECIVVWNIYKKYRNKVKHAIGHAKKVYLNAYLNDEDPRKLWSKIKSFSGLDNKSKNGKFVLDTEDHGTITDSESVANYFNSFFQNKVKTLQSKLNPSPEKVKEYVREFLGESLCRALVLLQ